MNWWQIPLVEHPEYIEEQRWANETDNVLTDLEKDQRVLIDEYSAQSLDDIEETFRSLFDGALALMKLNGLFVGAGFAIFQTQDDAPSAVLQVAMCFWLSAMVVLFFACRRRHRPMHADIRSIFETFRQSPRTDFREYICRYRHKHEAMYRIVISRESKLVNGSIVLTILGLALLILATLAG